MRLLAVDVGERRIGVAVSDDLNITAQPLGVIQRRSRKADMAELRQVAERYGVRRVVVGLPRNMNGSEGAAAELARTFAGWIASDLGLDVVMQDERLSTASAERVLLEADTSRRKRRRVVDKLAACVILQDYMQRRKSEEALGEHPDAS